MRIIQVFILSMGLMISACGEKENCDIDISTEFKDEIDAITSATILYAFEDTIENCEAYKSAYQAYIDALTPYKECDFSSEDQLKFDQTLTQAQKVLDEVEC